MFLDFAQMLSQLFQLPNKVVEQLTSKSFQLSYPTRWATSCGLSANLGQNQGDRAIVRSQSIVTLDGHSVVQFIQQFNPFFASLHRQQVQPATKFLRSVEGHEPDPNTTGQQIAARTLSDPPGEIRYITSHCGVNVKGQTSTRRKAKKYCCMAWRACVFVVKCFFMWGITVCRAYRKERSRL